MKRTLLYLFLGTAVLASCNNEGTETETPASETTETTTGSDLSTDVVTNPATDAETAPTGPTTSLSFAESEFDFGKIKEGEVVEHTFSFTNTGENDLIITNAKGSCGCTVPYYPTEPIPAGETAEIKVSFNSKGKSGVQRKTVTITANTDPAQTVLNLTSEVEKAEEGAAN